MRNGLLPTGSSIYLSYSILLPVLSYSQYPSCRLHQVKCDKHIPVLWRMVSFRLLERWNWALLLFHSLNCPSWMETDWLRLCGGVWWALQYPAVLDGIVLHCMVLCARALVGLGLFLLPEIEWTLVSIVPLFSCDRCVYNRQIFKLKIHICHKNAASMTDVHSFSEKQKASRGLHRVVYPVPLET